MMKNNIYLIVIIAFFNLSCSSKQEMQYKISAADQARLKQGIDSLFTDTQKRLYLESIFKKDQAVRNHQAEITQQNKANSKLNLVDHQEMDKQDIINLFCIKSYLSKYRYPSFDRHGEIAAYTPLLIFHHKASLKEFESHYSMFHKAYEEGNVTPSQFSLALRRIFQRKYNEKYSPLSTNENDVIKDLIKKINISTE